jgi:hypothetical protein
MEKVNSDREKIKSYEKLTSIPQGEQGRQSSYRRTRGCQGPGPPPDSTQSGHCKKFIYGVVRGLSNKWCTF